MTHKKGKGFTGKKHTAISKRSMSIGQQQAHERRRVKQGEANNG